MSELRKEVLECIDRIPDSTLEALWPILHLLRNDDAPPKSCGIPVDGPLPCAALPGGAGRFSSFSSTFPQTVAHHPRTGYNIYRTHIRYMGVRACTNRFTRRTRGC